MKSLHKFLIFINCSIVALVLLKYSVYYRKTFSLPELKFDIVIVYYILHILALVIA